MIEIQDLGCGDAQGEALVATSHEAGRIEILHTDYAPGCCPQEIQITPSIIDRTLSVGYALHADVCACLCALDVRYTIAGVGAGAWTIEAAESGVVATVTVP